MSDPRSQIKVLFVCRGNTCRSPMAEGVLRARLEAAGLGDLIAAASAGTHASDEPSPADPRAVTAAAACGVDIAAHRSQVLAADVRAHDLLIALDHANEATVAAAAAAPSDRSKVYSLMSFAPALGIAEVTDPFTGTPADYERALEQITAGVKGLFAHLATR